jgi:hypothetical protein
LDEYFDIDSGHKTIIPLGDKISKSTARPQEMIDAERRRVTEATGKKILSGKGADAYDVEHHEVLG